MHSIREINVQEQNAGLFPAYFSDASDKAVHHNSIIQTVLSTISKTTNLIPTLQTLSSKEVSQFLARKENFHPLIKIAGITLFVVSQLWTFRKEKQATSEDSFTLKHTPESLAERKTIETDKIEKQMASEDSFTFKPALESLAKSKAFEPYKNRQQYLFPGSMDAYKIGESIYYFGYDGKTQIEIDHEVRVTREALSLYIHSKHFFDWIRYCITNDTIWELCRITKISNLLDITAFYTSTRKHFVQDPVEIKKVLQFYNQNPQILLACMMYIALFDGYSRELHKEIESDITIFTPPQKEIAKTAILNLITNISAAFGNTMDALPVPIVFYYESKQVNFHDKKELREAFALAFQQSEYIFSTEKIEKEEKKVMKCPFSSAFQKFNKFSLWKQEIEPVQGLLLAELVELLNRKIEEKDPNVLAALTTITTKIALVLEK